MSMQLVQLLQRLSAEERGELLRRRGLDAASGADLGKLASKLADPGSLVAAFAELDQFQHLVLRWLADQPGHAAAWAALGRELDGRVPPDYLENALRELRLWGLVDYEAAPAPGYVATYGAVATSLPQPRGARLRELMANLDSETLRRMAMGLGLKAAPTRDQRERQLLDSLGNSDFCAGLAGRLSEPARDLLEWVRSEGGWVSQGHVKSNPVTKVTGLAAPTIWDVGAAQKPLDPLTELVHNRLLWEFREYRWDSRVSGYVVPREVEQALSGRSLFDTGPLQPPLLERAERARGLLPNPVHLMRDASHLLGFVTTGRCEFRQQDGEPYQRSLRALGKALQHPDAGYPFLLWNLCRASGLLHGADTTFTVAEAGLADPRTLYLTLLGGWSRTGWQGDYSLARVGNPRGLRMRLLELLVSLPADTWIERGSLEGLCAFLWPALFSPRYPGAGQAGDAALSSLLHLALAEGEAPDGTKAVLVPRAVQLLLTKQEGEEGGTLPPWDERWTVQPDRCVVVAPNAHPKALLELWRLAQIESNQGAAVFRLTAASVATALNRGMSPDAILKLLRGRSATPLPPTVERLIRDQGQRFGRIRVGAAQAYVRTDDPALLEELQRDRKLHGLEWQELAPGVAAVVNVGPTAAIEVLRKAGYLPVAERPGTQSPDTPRSNLPPLQVRQLQHFCRVAIRDGLRLSVRWSEGGRSRRAVIEPQELKDGHLYAYWPGKDEEVVLSLAAITLVSVAGGEEAGW
ncbi:MAG: helicase-associated domain-containing protein [Chloroflexi bacterium]|nr:helicase-associated domain-containing protein [Chloroflexota bacterium]